MEKQGTLVEKFDKGLWSSLVQEVVVNAKDDIRFIFKNGFDTYNRRKKFENLIIKGQIRQ